MPVAFAYVRMAMERPVSFGKIFSCRHRQVVLSGQDFVVPKQGEEEIGFEESWKQGE